MFCEILERAIPDSFPGIVLFIKFTGNHQHFNSLNIIVALALFSMKSFWIYDLVCYLQKRISTCALHSEQSMSVRSEKNTFFYVN